MTRQADAVGSVPAGVIEQPDVGTLDVEQHGFDHIAESERYLRPRALFSFWLGSNAYLYYVLIGAIVLSLGLSLAATIAAMVLGFAMYLLVGVASVGGARSGLPTMTLTRAPFGVRGNRINTLLAWFELLAFEALNAIFGVFAFVALAAEVGWVNS